MAFPTTAQLRELILPVTEARGYDVELIKATPAGKKSAVRIAVDADERPTLDDLEVVSREIGDVFDDAEASGDVNFGAGYTLEVSTPGVDMPLTEPRHWRRNRHRMVTLDDGPWRIGPVNPDETSVFVARSGEVRELQFTDDLSPVVDIEFTSPPQAELDVTGLSFEELREEHK